MFEREPHAAEAARLEQTAAALVAVQSASFDRANDATRTSYPPERRMSGEQLVAYLDARLYAVVATTRADGRPHAALSAFARVDMQLWLPTVSGSARSRNLARQPALSLVVSDGEGPDHAAVVIDGTADIVPVTGAPAEVDDAYAAKHGSSPEWASEWIVATPTRLFSFRDGDAIRLVPGDRELVLRHVGIDRHLADEVENRADVVAVGLRVDLLVDVEEAGCF
ncbi:MAG: pyridoxamine 5'-phosphate oxidase family protein [Mycobacteriales bacterium]